MAGTLSRFIWNPPLRLATNQRRKKRPGHFFRPGSPLQNDFRAAGAQGIPVRLSGLVLDRRRRPVPGALLDFWHANADGEYDLKGFGCRGHQFSDAGGRYLLETVVPGLYPGRTRHYHVRLQAANGRGNAGRLKARRTSAILAEQTPPGRFDASIKAFWGRCARRTNPFPARGHNALFPGVVGKVTKEFAFLLHGGPSLPGALEDKLPPPEVAPRPYRGGR